MYPGFNPEQLRSLAEIQKVSKLINCNITVDYWEGTILLKMESTDENAKKTIPEILDSLGRMWAEQLHMLFAMSGKLIKRNEGKVRPT